MDDTTFHPRILNGLGQRWSRPEIPPVDPDRSQPRRPNALVINWYAGTILTNGKSERLDHLVKRARAGRSAEARDAADELSLEFWFAARCLSKSDHFIELRVAEICDDDPNPRRGPREAIIERTIPDVPSYRDDPLSTHDGRPLNDLEVVVTDHDIIELDERDVSFFVTSVGPMLRLNTTEDTRPNQSRVGLGPMWVLSGHEDPTPQPYRDLVDSLLLASINLEERTAIRALAVECTSWAQFYAELVNRDVDCNDLLEEIWAPQSS